MRTLLTALLLAAVVPLGAIGVQASGVEPQGPPPPPQPPAAQARDTRVARTGTSQLTGRVVSGETGAPLRKAIVRLNAMNQPDVRSTTTDADGHFEFRDLPGGSYNLYVSRPGYVVGPETSRLLTVKVGEADKVRQADIVMTRACAIAGRVLDEYGEPLDNVRVEVLQSRFVNGARTLNNVGGRGGATNDLGQFRAYGLPPGRYYVAASLPLAVYSQEASDDRSGYARTYYPGTPNLADAQLVEVRAGQDALNIDLVLVAVRTARVSGVGVDALGHPIAGGSVNIGQVTPGMMGFSSTGTSLKPDGSFTIPSLAPGDYFITVQTSSNGGQQASEAGGARVTVAGSDITDLVIRTGRGATVSGQLMYEGATPPAARAARVVVGAATADPVGEPQIYRGQPESPQPVHEDGTFSLSGLFGQRLFRVSGLPQGWALKTVLMNGRDVTDTPMAFEGREQITGLQVVVTDRITRITGTVAGEGDQPVETATVMVFADDPARWAPGTRFQGNGAVRNGAPFRIEGLPPGDYLAVAFDSPSALAMFVMSSSDTDPREQLRKLAVKFSLAPGEARDLKLTVVKPPEPK
jgi:hypothetical protein